MIVSFMQEIYLRFHDDLARNLFLYVAPVQATFYREPTAGWESVIKRFSCSYDVDEARKCIALDRPTAAVFHLMRVVESAVLELQIFLREREM